MGRPEYPARQSKRNVLKGRIAMNDTLGPLMERNLLEVFGQRDSARRATVIAEIYTADCTFNEAEGELHSLRLFVSSGEGHPPRASR
jgi:hypothetical protein